MPTRLLDTDPSASEFIDGMLAEHPDRGSITTLMFGAASLGLV